MDERFLLPPFQNESVRNLSHKNELNEPVGESHMNGFVLKLVLT